MHRLYNARPKPPLPAKHRCWTTRPSCCPFLQRKTARVLAARQPWPSGFSGSGKHLAVLRPRARIHRARSIVEWPRYRREFSAWPRNVAPRAKRRRAPNYRRHPIPPRRYTAARQRLRHESSGRAPNGPPSLRVNLNLNLNCRVIPIRFCGCRTSNPRPRRPRPSARMLRKRLLPHRLLPRHPLQCSGVRSKAVPRKLKKRAAVWPQLCGRASKLPRPGAAVRRLLPRLYPLLHLQVVMLACSVRPNLVRCRPRRNRPPRLHRR